MRFLRRNAKETAETADEGAAEVMSAAEQNSSTARTRTTGKGRPTPKRREAERRRRGPVPPPPRTQREAMRRMRGNKEERRRAAAERRERMMAGDDRYLMPRDRGPVRAYVRDLVDSRRNLMGFFMPLAIVVFLALLVPSVRVQQYATLFCTVMLALMIIEGLVLGMIVTRRVRAKFPNATDRGLSLGWYAFVRASQVRRLRVPRPRVRVGERPA
ncbi:DUF3043 domain-containing protein [Gandjariella thermophila]|uniref:DUF3043 domain-containing protein n=1 Tax=Gandjariella thermophila TaxID=1931992 RepID=A0A4D4J962_9PSEU|nr:DUF3043 domain-containing protein [Gandjariella thermophila]GDY30403.1 hypothetical protein GTS_20360 [Gandjariella thermophila]